MTDIVAPSTLGSCYVSEESAFCTTGTERRCYPISDTLDYEATQAELDRKGLAVSPFDIKDPVLGFKDATVKLGHYLQPPPTVLTSSATVDGDASAPLAVFARCIFGGQSVFAGSTVLASSGTASGCSTASGHGSRFPAGQLCLVTDPADGLVPARILSRSSDALTFYPSASGSLADASALVNLWTFYPTHTNTRSLSVGIAAAQQATHQFRFKGCTGSAEIKVERDGLAQMMFDLKAADWTGPSSLSLSTADATDPMAAPLSCRNAVLYFQAQGTTTRTNYKVDSFSAKLNFGNKHLTTLTGGTEGKRSTFRGDGLTVTFAEIELTFALDTTPDSTWWASRTELTCMLWVYVDDADNARRSIVIDVPRAIVVGKPKHAKGADGLVKTTVKLRAKLDDSVTGSTELATAPFRLGIG
jgi:hypothetical protein